VSSISANRPVARPATLSVSASLAWTAGMVLAGLLVLYLVGVDQGATSILGSDAHIHEFVHDARHLLGFPCH
jgi:Probable cobalt transporter subunit (CbtB)